MLHSFWDFTFRSQACRNAALDKCAPAGIAAESKPAKRFGANFEATDVDDEMSTARIALATGAGLKRDSSPQRRAVEGTEAGRKFFRDLRRAYMRVCCVAPSCQQHALCLSPHHRLSRSCDTIWHEQPVSCHSVWPLH